MTPNHFLFVMLEGGGTVPPQVTFNVRGTGSDGSKLSFHEIEHVSVSASGVIIAFGKLTCH